MHPGLRHKQPATGSQGTMDLGQKSFAIGNLVDHPEGQGEIHRFRHAHPIRRANHGLDPLEHPRLAGANRKSLQHAWLQIHSQDPSLGPNQSGQGNGEVTHATTRFEHHVPRLNPRREDLLGRVQPAPQGIVEGGQQPPRTGDFRTDAVLHFDPLVS